MPRPVIPGEKRALNKQVAEALANQVYTLEIEGGAESEIWALRRAAWAMDDLEQNVGLVARQLGLQGLANIPGVKTTTAQEILRLVEKFTGAADKPQVSI